jgi:hypothetical protein
MVKGITLIIFSLADNVHDLVKQALKIEVQQLDSQTKDRVARAMIARIARNARTRVTGSFFLGAYRVRQISPPRYHLPFSSFIHHLSFI